MKRLIFSPYLMLLITYSLLLPSCSDQHKAKRAIKEELRLSLHDYSSYEPVKFGKPEVAFSSVDDQPDFKGCLDLVDKYIEIHDEYQAKLEIYDSEYFRDKYWQTYNICKAAMDSANSYLSKAEKIKAYFTPKIIGWKVRHSYRAKNLAGNLGIHHYEYYFDSEFKSVIKSVDLSDSKN